MSKSSFCFALFLTIFYAGLMTHLDWFTYKHVLSFCMGLVVIIAAITLAGNNTKEELLENRWILEQNQRILERIQKMLEAKEKEAK